MKKIRDLSVSNKKIIYWIGGVDLCYKIRAGKRLLFFVASCYVDDQKSEMESFLGKKYFHYSEINDWCNYFVVICSEDTAECERVAGLLSAIGLKEEQYATYQEVIEIERDIKSLPVQIRDDNDLNFTDRGKAYWKLAASFFEKGRSLRILEIGVYKASLIKGVKSWLNDYIITEYVGIDPYLGMEGDPYFGTYYSDHSEATSVFEYSNEIYESTGFGKLQRMTSDEFFASNADVEDEKRFDIIIIDGDHSYQACLKDMQHARKLLKKDGILLLDDYGNVDARDVTRAVNHFIFNSIKEIKELKYDTISFRNIGRFIPLTLTVVGVRFE